MSVSKIEILKFSNKDALIYPVVHFISKYLYYHGFGMLSSKLYGIHKPFENGSGGWRWWNLNRHKSFQVYIHMTLTVSVTVYCKDELRVKVNVYAATKWRCPRRPTKCSCVQRWSVTFLLKQPSLLSLQKFAKLSWKHYTMLW